MRNLFFILTLSLFFVSCEKEDITVEPFPAQQIELELHAIVACGGEFDIDGENPQTWGQRIVDAVSAQGLTIIAFEVNFQEVEHPGFCGNCAPTGDILKVVAPEEEAEELRSLGFR